jgi:3-methylcrotonyl-CoA carboxylase alpha subunit
VLALAVAGLLLSEQQAGSDPWQSSHGWRMNLPLIRELRFSEEEQQIVLSLQYSAGSYHLQIAGVSHAMQIRQSAGNQIQLNLDDITLSGEIVWDGEKVHVFTAGQHTELHYHDPLAHAGDAEAEGGRLTAPMPGKIVADD